jgi:DNA-binding MarR family transcriptional regulator
MTRPLKSNEIALILFLKTQQEHKTTLTREELASTLGFSKTQLAYTIDALDLAGYIERTKSDYRDDTKKGAPSRKVSISLTQKGEEAK